MDSLHLPRGRALSELVYITADEEETQPLDLTGWTLVGAIYQLSGGEACPLAVTVIDAAGGEIKISISAPNSAALVGSSYAYRVDMTDPSGVICDFKGDLHVTPF